MPHRPMTNAERQRAFAARNPGYYRKYKARRLGADCSRDWMTVAAQIAARKAAAASADVPSTAAPEFASSTTAAAPTGC